MMSRALTLAVLLLSSFAVSQQATTINVLTRMNDNQHTGQNLQETILTPTNVNSTSFGKIFSYSVDGQVYAQPLYVQNLTMATGGVHNVVFVATEYDSVYAFDADSAIANPQPLWHVNFLNPPAIQPVSCSEGSGICQLYPLVGITATPVIDLATNTIYVEVRTQEISNGVTSWVQRIHALNITSGAEQPNSPAVICSAQGRNGCALSNQSSTVIFGPAHQQSRVGTMLVPEPGFPQGVYFIGFSGDSGWVLAYDPVSLQLLAGWYTDDEQVHTTAFLNAPGAANNWVGAGFGVTMPGIFPGIPGEGHSGIWGAGTGLSADSNGYVYAITGDGYWDGSVNWGDSLVKLQLQYNSSTKTYSLVPVDYFTTSDQACRDAHGLDYGSAGPLILPTQPGATYPNLIFTTGKQVKTCESTFEGYVINANNMGHTGGQVSQMSLSNGGGEQPAAYWYNGTTQYIYNGSDGDPLRAYTLSTAGVSTNSVMATQAAFDSGLNPVISANGTQNGIVWGLERIDDPDEYQPGTSPWVLHAFNANTLAELYNTTQASAGRDTPGPNLKMTVPTVANGKVYVPTQTELDIYGLCPCPATH